MSQSAKFAAIDIDYAKFAKHGDIMLAIGVVIILMVMMVPMPTLLLDLLLTFSISISIVVLITCMFMQSPWSSASSRRFCWSPR